MGRPSSPTWTQGELRGAPQVEVAAEYRGLQLATPTVHGLQPHHPSANFQHWYFPEAARVEQLLPPAVLPCVVGDAITQPCDADPWSSTAYHARDVAPPQVGVSYSERFAAAGLCPMAPCH